MWHQHTLETTKSQLSGPQPSFKPQQYPGAIATATLEICLSTAKPSSRQSHPCCPQPTLVASIAIAGGPQQTTVVPSHHYGGPQLTHAQHPCRHNNNLIVLCLTHHSTQEVLSHTLYQSQWSSTDYSDHYSKPVGP